MIVVLGPADLADAVAVAAPRELVVGARDDDRLAGPVVEAAEIASFLPLPARACVIAAWMDPHRAAAAVQRAGGALEGSRVYVIGDPPSGTSLEAWRTRLAEAEATPVRDTDELQRHLEGIDGEPAPAPSAAERRAMRPGAPEAAAWRSAMRAAPTGRLRSLLRRRRTTDKPTPETSLDLIIRRPLAVGCHSVAVISPKGGVGKTLLSFLLGSVLARVRRDRILVVDTNPDFGSLADLAPAVVPATISDLLRDLDTIETYEDVSAYTTTTDSGMEILAAPQDPVMMGMLGREGYQAVSDLVHRHYDVVVYDCGTGFLDETTRFALQRVDQTVVVSTPQLVTTKMIVAAIDHLGAIGFDPTRCTLALNMVRRDDILDRARLRTAMSSRVGGTVEVPFDDRVRRAADEGLFDYDRLGGSLRVAVKRLAAEIIGRLPGASLAWNPDETTDLPPPDPSPNGTPGSPEHGVPDALDAAAPPTAGDVQGRRSIAGGGPVARLALDWDPAEGT